MTGFLKTIWAMGILLLFTVAAAYFVGMMFSAPSGNVALIKIKGEISSDSGLFSNTASPDKIISQIQEANKNPEVQALLIEINSPGGAVVATKEIANALEAVKKPKVCWMRDVAASGAYWIATACDKIVADEFTITGSIGVTGSYLEFSGLFEKYGIGYVRLVSGEGKDAGTSYREPTKEELQSIQILIDEMHNAFVAEVAENRNLSVDSVSKIADGSMFIGRKAMELGLVDVLGSKQESFGIIKEMTNVTEIEIMEFEEEFGIMDLMSGFFSKGIVDYMFSNEFKVKAI